MQKQHNNLIFCYR